EMTVPSSPKRFSCSHVFHAHCLRCWFQLLLTCPTCRTDILFPRRSANVNEAAAVVVAAQAAAPPPPGGAAGGIPPLPPFPPNFFHHLAGNSFPPPPAAAPAAGAAVANGTAPPPLFLPSSMNSIQCMAYLEWEE
ncbi:hypothetical protein PENTCL1PPCAC_3168, partial [Pristionchus entomophagus]